MKLFVGPDDLVTPHCKFTDKHCLRPCNLIVDLNELNLNPPIPNQRKIMQNPSLIQKIQTTATLVFNALDALQPVVSLLARLYVAQVFFLAGLTKVRDWETTLLLFTEEYKVPLLSPQIAAVMGTAGELVLPLLLVLGFGSRLAALGLSVVNVVAVLALEEIAPAAFQQHVLWGVLLVGIAVYGPGRLALDSFVARQFGKSGFRGQAAG